MAKEIITVTQTPGQSMAPAPQETIRSGGKILIFDGKRDTELGKPAPAAAAAPDDKKAGAADADKKADDKKTDDKASALSGLDALKKSLGFWKEDKKADDKKAADKKAEDDKKLADDAAAKAGDKAADDKKADDERDKAGRFTKRPKSAITPDLVETVVQTATRAAVEANKASAAAAAKDDKKPDPTEDLSEADKRNLEVLSYMAKSDEKYKGLDRQFIKFAKESASYQAEWEKENPGKEFNPEDSDHDTFYAKHEPKYNQADFDEARINMQLDSRMRDREKQMDERYGKIEAKLLEQELAPAVDKKAGESIQAMVAAVDPEAAKVLAEKGHEGLAEQDPLAFEVLDRTAADMRVLVGELEKLNHPSGRFRFDERNPAHKFLDEFAAGLEQHIKRLPFEDQVRDGKMFATQSEIRGLPEAQRARYWTLNSDVISEELVKSMAQGAKNVLAAERAKLDKYIKAKGGGAAKAPDKADDKKAADAKPGADKPNSPAASTDAGSASASSVQNNNTGTSVQTLVSRLWPS